MTACYHDSENQKERIRNKYKGINPDYRYELGGENVIPKSLRNTDLPKIDKMLRTTSFACSDGKCTCGQGKSAGKYMAELFKKLLKLPEPNEINLTKPSK